MILLLILLPLFAGWAALVIPGWIERRVITVFMGFLHLVVLGVCALDRPLPILGGWLFLDDFALLCIAVADLLFLIIGVTRLLWVQRELADQQIHLREVKLFVLDPERLWGNNSCWLLSWICLTALTRNLLLLMLTIPLATWLLSRVHPPSSGASRGRLARRWGNTLLIGFGVIYLLSPARDPKPFVFFWELERSAVGESIENHPQVEWVIVFLCSLVNLLTIPRLYDVSVSYRGQKMLNGVTALFWIILPLIPLYRSAHLSTLHLPMSQWMPWLWIILTILWVIVLWIPFSRQEAILGKPMKS